MKLPQSALLAFALEPRELFIALLAINDITSYVAMAVFSCSSPRGPILVIFALYPRGIRSFY
jgi:hypothetical protein